MMTSSTQAQEDWYGIPFHSERIMELSRKVICLSVTAGVLGLVTVVSQFESGGSASYIPLALLVAGWALMVPACGYFGARDANVTLTGLFCGCSLLSAIFSAVQILMACLAIAEIYKDPNCGNLCLQDKTPIIIFGGLVACCAVPKGCLYACSFWRGNALHKELQQAQPPMAQAPAVATVSVQPVQSV